MTAEAPPSTPLLDPSDPVFLVIHEGKVLATYADRDAAKSDVRDLRRGLKGVRIASPKPGTENWDRVIWLPDQNGYWRDEEPAPGAVADHQRDAVKMSFAKAGEVAAHLRREAREAVMVRLRPARTIPVALGDAALPAAATRATAGRLPPPSPCPAHEATACQPGHPDDPSLCRWCGEVCDDAPSSSFWTRLPDGPARRPAALAEADNLWVKARAAREAADGDEALLKQDAERAYAIGFTLRSIDIEAPSADLLASLGAFAEAKGAKVLAAYLRDAADASAGPTDDLVANVAEWALAWRALDREGSPKAAEALEHLRRAADALFAVGSPSTPELAAPTPTMDPARPARPGALLSVRLTFRGRDAGDAERLLDDMLDVGALQDPIHDWARERGLRLKITRANVAVRAAKAAPCSNTPDGIRFVSVMQPQPPANTARIVKGDDGWFYAMAAASNGAALEWWPDGGLTPYKREDGTWCFGSKGGVS